MKTIIRTEQRQDQVAINHLTREAFAGRPYAGGNEQDIIDLLRSNNALVLSLVALQADTPVGQVTFSNASNDDGSAPWFALGPVAVLPKLQGQGIGAALINEGLERLKEQGALGCILTGNPDYYHRFGFQVSSEHAPDGEPAAYFQVKLFSEIAPKGRFSFAKEFYSAGPKPA